jgi:saccharopine dehydrogenase-like NADP-dependent oxidoreductase
VSFYVRKSLHEFMLSIFSSIIDRIKQLTSFPDASEEARILSGMRWIGLFSSTIVTPRAGNLLDTLCARLEALMAYEEGERDLVMLQHKFFVEWADGKTVSIYAGLYILLRGLTIFAGYYHLDP